MSNIETIAREAEVSIATVSRALRAPENTISENQRRIVDIARQLGYNFDKRRKRTLSRKTRQIVFLAFSQTLSPESLHEDATYMPIVNGINKVIGEEGYNLIVSDVGVDEKTPPSLLREEVDGIIFHGLMSQEFYHKYVQPLPHVGIQHYDPLLDCNWVITDQWSIGFRTVEYLYKLGHRRIAFLSDMGDKHVTRERYRGYCDALEIFGLEFDDKLVKRWQRPAVDGIIPMETELPDYSLQVEQLLKNSVTAIICTDDFRALATVKTLEKCGYSVPDDIAVTGGHNDHPRFGFNGCSSNLGAVCRYAAKLVMEIINGARLLPVKIMIQPTFHEGTSVKN
ncbi:MAG: LacI family DNA-binding transcriptional regulator [Victivallales bacterium]